MNETAQGSRTPDVLTVASIAILAYVIADISHEGVGHGGACLLVGCSPHLLTTMQFDGDASQLPAVASRVIAAGGSVVNLLVGVFAAIFLRSASPAKPAKWLLLWLLASISLMQATGYLLFSGLGGVGDWVNVVAGLPGGGLWRVALIAIGAVGYWLVVRWSMKQLGTRLRTPAPVRAREAYRYTLVAYLTGGVLAIVAGVFDPAAGAIILISGVAASLGGTSGLAWGPQLLRNPKLVAPTDAIAPLIRDWRWITAGAICAIGYVAILGPGIRF